MTASSEQADEARPAESWTCRRAEWVARILIVLAVVAVMLPVVLHPSEVIYSSRSDLFAFIHPYRALQNRSVQQHGRLTLWDPTSFGGMPVVGNPQAGLFYPPNWLHLIDAEGEGEAFHGWLILLHLVVGGLGVLWWLRHHGLSLPARVAAALVFMFAGKWMFHVLAQGHVVFLPMMWMPWQCGLLDLIWRRATARRVAMLAVVAALVLLGCHTQLVLYSQAFVAIYGAVAGLLWTRGVHAREEVLRVIIGLAAAAFLTFGLTALSVMPLLSDLDLYVRGEGLDYETAAARALPVSQLVELFVPQATPLGHEPRPDAGLLALPLAAFALLSRARRKLALVGAAGVGLLCWYGVGSAGGLHRLLFDWVPGFDLFRIPSRVFLILGLPLGLLVALGLDELSGGRGGPRGERRRRALAAALAVAGMVAFIAYGTGPTFLLLLAFSLPCLFLLPLPERWRRVLPWAVVGLLFLDQARLAAPLVETRSLEEALGENPLARRIAGPYGDGRVLSFNWRSAADLSALPPTYATRAGIESLRGFNPLVPLATHEYLLRGVANQEPGLRPGVTIRTFPIVSRKHLDLFNVRWIVTNAALDIDGVLLRETFDGVKVYHYQLPSEFTEFKRTFLYENTKRMPRAAIVRNALAVSDGESAIEAIGSLDPRRVVLVEDEALVGSHPGSFETVPVRHSGDEIELDLDAGAGGFLVLSEIWYPGWKAQDNGEPIAVHRGNAVFQVLRLAPGTHHIRLAYRPTAYVWASPLALVSLLVVAGCTRYG